MIRSCLSLAFLLTLPLAAQQGPTTTIQPFQSPGGFKITPLKIPAISPGQVTLMELEGRFAQDVAKGGGKAFASWFADDAVALSNGEPAQLGHAAIAASAQWDPATYQLTWSPEGAQMGPGNDMGFTWGRYESKYTGTDGKPVVKDGRFITVWKKVHNEWKVAMDASADAPPVPPAP